MRLALAALILAASASATFAQDKDAKKDDALKGDLAKIQGKWTAMVGPEKNIPIVVEFKDKVVNILVTVQERDLKIKGEIKLDEAKDPKEWDWTKFETSDGQKVEDNLAIYKFDGEKLILCSGGPGNPRPTTFKDGEGGMPSLIEFTRVKDDKKEEAKKEK